MADKIVNKQEKMSFDDYITFWSKFYNVPEKILLGKSERKAPECPMLKSDREEFLKFLERHRLEMVEHCKEIREEIHKMYSECKTKGE